MLKLKYQNKNTIERTSYYNKNKDKIRRKQKEYEKRTRNARREYFRNWEKNKLATDPAYKIRKHIGNRLRAALKKKYKK